MERISRFLFPYLTPAEATNLAACSKTVVSESVPVSWVSRTVHVSSPKNPMDICTSSLVVIRPNMSRLESMVREMPDLKELVLVFSNPKLYYNWDVDLRFFKGTLYVIGKCPQNIIFYGSRKNTLEEQEEQLQDGTIQDSLE